MAPKRKTETDDFGPRIAEAYAAEGAALQLGRGVLEGETHQDAVVQIPAAMVNRHGLIAGATGTGKTKTLQLMAEQLSAMGVPVFAADIKGDLSGLSKPGEASERVAARSGGPRRRVDAPWGRGDVLRPRRDRRRRSPPGDGLVVRAAAAGQGPRRQRHADVVALARVPLRRRQRAGAPRSRRPARGPEVPRLRRGQGGAEGDRRRLDGDDRRAPPLDPRARGPGRRGLLRRTRARRRRPAAGRQRRAWDHQLPRAGRRAGQAEAVLDVPHVAAGRALPRAARGRRPRQAQARLLLRRGPPAVRGRAPRSSSIRSRRRSGSSGRRASACSS